MIEEALREDSRTSPGAYNSPFNYIGKIFMHPGASYEKGLWSNPVGPLFFGTNTAFDL